MDIRVKYNQEQRVNDFAGLGAQLPESGDRRTEGWEGGTGPLQCSLGSS